MIRDATNDRIQDTLSLLLSCGADMARDVRQSLRKRDAVHHIFAWWLSVGSLTLSLSPIGVMEGQPEREKGLINYLDISARDRHSSSLPRHIYGWGWLANKQWRAPSTSDPDNDHNHLLNTWTDDFVLRERERKIQNSSFTEYSSSLALFSNVLFQFPYGMSVRQ